MEGIKRNKCTKLRNLIIHRKWIREVCRCSFLRERDLQKNLKPSWKLNPGPSKCQLHALTAEPLDVCQRTGNKSAQQYRLQLSFSDCTASDKWRFSMDVVVGLLRLTTQPHLFLLSTTSASTVILFLDVLSPTTQHASTVESIQMVTKRSAAKIQQNLAGNSTQNVLDAVLMLLPLSHQTYIRGAEASLVKQHRLEASGIASLQKMPRHGIGAMILLCKVQVFLEFWSHSGRVCSHFKWKLTPACLFLNHEWFFILTALAVWAHSRLTSSRLSANVNYHYQAVHGSKW